MTRVKCKECHGEGRFYTNRPDISTIQCPICKGAGWLDKEVWDEDSHEVDNEITYD